jgi:hypothetical protein
MSDHKKRVMDALLKYHAKDLKEIESLCGRGKKNKKPEKLVEAECLLWMRSQGWKIEVYESKATFDPRRGIYRNQGVMAGTCDIMGVLPSGIAIAIELKAPGKLSTFNKMGNQRQVDFITDRINTNCFACVVDGVDYLRTIYLRWEKFRSEDDFIGARNYLMDCLP